MVVSPELNAEDLTIARSSGVPDLGLLTMTEVLNRVREVVDAVRQVARRRSELPVPIHRPLAPASCRRFMGVPLGADRSRL